MKKVILSLSAVLLAVQAFATDSAHLKKTPEERANRQTAQLEKALGLRADQKAQVYQAAWQKHTQIDAIQLKYKDSSRKQGMKAEIATVKATFDLNMDKLLDSEQKLKYAAYKKEHADENKKPKHKQKRKRPASSQTEK